MNKLRKWKKGLRKVKIDSIICSLLINGKLSRELKMRLYPRKSN